MIVHLDFRQGPHCQNAEAAGGLCHKCNKCGRFDEGGDLAPDILRAMENEARRAAEAMPAARQNPLSAAMKRHRVAHRIRMVDAAEHLGMALGRYIDLENGVAAPTAEETAALEGWIGGAH